MIGAFDSGIGGLTVVKAIWKLLPQAPLIYFGDTARTPYGNKSAEVVSTFGVEAARFLVSRGVTVLVVACNTVSAVGMDALKNEFPALPIFEVITPAVEKVRGLSKSKRVGIIGTRALVNSNIYKNLLTNEGFQVFQQAAPLLVPLVEENWLDKPETKRIIKGYLRALKQQQVDTLVLACTHYPLLKKIIASRVGKKVKIVDPADEVAVKLKEYLATSGNQEQLGSTPSHFYVSDLTPHFQEIAQKWLDRKINLEKVSLHPADNGTAAQLIKEAKPRTVPSGSSTGVKL
ncbi:MAG: glutamate racemase [Patescibacteria group bacterium]